jgi:hypothetical protein
MESVTVSAFGDINTSKERDKDMNKVQTGLRIPEERYNELCEVANEMGVSLNSLLLMLIDLGMTLRNGRVTVQATQ